MYRKASILKKYIIYAGVNGSGKSTLYQTQKNNYGMNRINVDEIAASIGDWRNPLVQIQAGKQAVKMLAEYLNEGETFNQETTLCGRSIMNHIRQAKKLGYTIEMHYVGVDNVEIAKKRVADRVQAGGHGIKDSDIERRYTETFTNLKMVAKECDLLVLYDNTNHFRRFCILKKGEVVRISSEVPNWYRENVNF